MSDFFAKLKKLREALLPDPAWLLRAKAELLIFISRHPIPEKASFIPRHLPSIFPRVAWVVAGAILMLAGFSGINSLAASSLPGDLLYTVKREIFEPAAVLLAKGDPQERARISLAIAQRRLIEIEAVASAAGANAQTLRVLAVDAEQAAANAAAAAPSLELAALLRVHSSALKALAERETVKGESGQILAELGTRLLDHSASAAGRNVASARDEIKLADRGKASIAKAEARLSQARRSVAAHERELDPATLSGAAKRLEKAERSLARAKEELKTEGLSQAVAEAERSLNTAVETAALVEVAATARLKLRVREPEARALVAATSSESIAAASTSTEVVFEDLIELVPVEAGEATSTQQ